MPQVDGDTYFNNFVQSGYDELKTWTPAYYRDILEADANLQFAGKTVDEMSEKLESFVANMFIDTMDESTLTRMEAFYYLDNADRTLDERRRLLKAAQLGSGKMDIDRIKRIIQVYAGVDCSIDFIHEIVILLDAGNSKIRFSDFTDILGKQLPAHLKWHVDQEVGIKQSIYTGAIFARTYIRPTIEEATGDRDRSIDQEQEYFGAAITNIHVGYIQDGGDRERAIESNAAYCAANTTKVYIGVPLQDGGDRTGEISGTEISGTGMINTISQTIS